MFSALLIGNRIKVTKSTDRSLSNVEGTVIDETMNTLLIEIAGQVRLVLPKKAISIERFNASSAGMLSLNGIELVGNPVERIHKD